MNKAIHRLPDSIQFIDLRAQRELLGKRIDDAILKVVNHGAYILGPEVAQLEAALAELAGTTQVISCASGTDALALVLMALGVGAGDAVLCPSFTFAATAEVIAWTGATPVFVDVLPKTFCVDARSLEIGITDARNSGLRPVGVIPVDLFGQPADYASIMPVATKEKLWVMCDAAQAFGAMYHGTRVGALGQVTTTSFFPAKPLGCYGDGGAIFTNDVDLASVVRSLRVHGQGTDKYDNVRIGMNGRLDTIQAAVLLEKLRIFPDEIAARQGVAARYTAGLQDIVETPHVPDTAESVWAQYTIRSPNRDRIAATLKECGIPTAVYYAKPLHRQTAYCKYPVAAGALPISDTVANEVLSLPMHPYLAPQVQDFIINSVRAAASRE